MHLSSEKVQILIQIIVELAGKCISWHWFREQSLKTTFQAWDIWMSQQNSTRLSSNQLWKNFSFANISQRNGTFMDRIQFLERSRGCANYKSYNLWAINIKKSTKNLRRCGLSLLLCHSNGHSGHILSKFRSKNVIN